MSKAARGSGIRRPTARLLAATTLGLMAVAGEPAAAAVPEVIAELRIDSNRVAGALGNRKTSVEEVAAGFLKEAAKAHFPYVCWVTPGEASVGSAPRLILHMIEIPVAGWSPGIWLRLGAELRGEEHWLSEELELYPYWRDSPPFNAPEDQGVFEDDLRYVIRQAASETRRLDCQDCRGWFFSDALRKDIEEQFLSKVSLVDRVVLEEPKVFLPLRREDLLASTESQLLVEFWLKSEQPGGDRSELWLSPWAYAGDSIHCRLTKLTAPAKGISETWADDHFWHESLPDLLSAPNLVRLGVLMKDYRRDSHAGVTTVGDVVTGGP